MLANITYDPSAPHHIQTFPVLPEVVELGVDVGIVIFKIESNWGADFTCLYRVSPITLTDCLLRDMNADAPLGQGARRAIAAGTGIITRRVSLTPCSAVVAQDAMSEHLCIDRSERVVRETIGPWDTCICISNMVLVPSGRKSTRHDRLRVVEGVRIPAWRDGVSCPFATNVGLAYWRDLRWARLFTAGHCMEYPRRTSPPFRSGLAVVDICDWPDPYVGPPMIRALRPQGWADRNGTWAGQSPGCSSGGRWWHITE